ncbi:MAG: hypothetical protein OCC45_01190 [Desulfotalea sp.]
MLTFIFGVIGIILIVLQTALLPESIYSLIQFPDLIFIFIVYCAYRFNLVQGLFLVFIISWLQDVIGAVALGVYPVECLVVFAVFKLVSKNNPINNVWYQYPLVGLAYLGMQIFMTISQSLVNPESARPLQLIFLSVESVVLVLVTIPCFCFFNLINNWLERRGHSTKPRRKLMMRKV